MSHVALGVEALAIEGGDAAGFLTAMLQGVQAKRSDLGRAGGVEDAEDAAFQPQPVVVAPGIGRFVVHRAFSTSIFSELSELLASSALCAESLSSAMAWPTTGAICATSASPFGANAFSRPAEPAATG